MLGDPAQRVIAIDIGAIVVVTALGKVARRIVFKAHGKKRRLVGRDRLVREVAFGAVAEAAREMRSKFLVGNPADGIPLDAHRLVLVDADGNHLIQRIEFISDGVAEAGLASDAVAVRVVGIFDGECPLHFLDQATFGVELAFDAACAFLVSTRLPLAS